MTPFYIPQFLGSPSGDGVCSTYVEAIYDNLWNDAPCDLKFYFICENPKVNIPKLL